MNKTQTRRPIVKRICQYKECGKEYQGVLQSKYCGPVCRNKNSPSKIAVQAKEIECRNCRQLFKRKSARDYNCAACRDHIKVREAAGIKQNDGRILIREYLDVESDMIQQFLNKKK